MMQNTTYSLWRQRLGYGVADLSCNLVWQLISLYLMFFYTDIMGLPAYYAGLMFLVTRLVDGVADVLMGLVAAALIYLLARCLSACCA
jgi:GPH family glycoside/pentoside/hexuronide:cation symporter